MPWFVARKIVPFPVNSLFFPDIPRALLPPKALFGVRYTYSLLYEFCLQLLSCRNLSQ